MRCFVIQSSVVRSSLLAAGLTAVGILSGIGVSSAQAQTLERIGETPVKISTFQASLGLSVTPTADANTLVNAIIQPGITVSNASFTGGTGNPLFSAGTFTAGQDTGIGLDQGIILTSGDVTLAPGPNELDGAGRILGLPGDSDLNSLIPGFSTNDATILEFDFETTTGEFFIQYTFASEEYNEFVNSSFNDVFGFFLNGNNIALIPNTNTPVSINNVNGGNPLGTNASNPAFYNNNDLNDGGPFFNIEYDGLTDVFVAKVTGLPAGTNTIKLAIADAGDSILDSAVFIKSIGSTPPSTPEPGTILGLLAVGGLGLSIKHRR